MRFAERLLGLHDALTAGQVPYAFGGAIALAYWVLEPRTTRDLDVNVFVAAEQPAGALAALPAGVTVTDDAAAVVARDGQIRLWWDETPVDLFFDTLEIHAQAARGARRVPFGEVEIPILGPVELAVFKAMFDRGKDWVDIEAILAADSTTPGEVRRALRPLIGAEDPRWKRLAQAEAAAHPA